MALAFKFDLVRPNDSRRVGYYGFAWSTLFMGPLAPLMRRDFGDSFLLMLGEVLICVIVFMFDRDPLLLIARLGVITLIWALLYNELYTLGLMASGFRVDGPHEVVAALEERFPAQGRSDRIRMLRERCLLLVVLGLACLQIFSDSVLRAGFVNVAQQSPSTKSVSPTSDAPRPTPPPSPTPTATPSAAVVPSAAETPRPTATPAPTFTPTSEPSPTAVPRAAAESPRPTATPAPTFTPTSEPSPTAVPRAETPRPIATPAPTFTPTSTPSPTAVPTAADTPRPIPIPTPTPTLSPTAIPRVTETPRPPAKSAAVILAEQQRACDAAMGSQFDSDLPPGTAYVPDTSALSEADIDQAIASCEAARAGPSRRFNTQLGRAYAARAVLLASKGSFADAVDYMNRAIAQWTAAEAQGSGAAMNFLGALYKGTFNIPTYAFLKPVYPTALRYWQNGDKAGNLKATRNAGGMLLLGPEEFPGVAQDINRARELLLKAINGNDMAAASVYGQALFYGYPPGVGRNHGAEGIGYLIRACNAGDSSAKAFFDKEFAKPSKSPLLPVTRPAGC
jgi:hypothetical protein